VDIKHHPHGSGPRLPWTAPGYYARLAYQIWSEHMLRGLRPPDLAFRAHIHQPGDSGTVYPTRLIVTPPWQAATEWVHRIGVENYPTFGGTVVLFEPGRYEVTHLYYRPDPPKPWSPCAGTDHK
jgi:hypothetical protein